MRLVVVESPFAGDIEANLTYVRRCMKDCFAQGEYPWASHALYTQPGVLDDTDPMERALGIAAGLAWASKAEASVVYVDRGISSGMREGVNAAMDAGREIEFRSLDGIEWDSSEDVVAFVNATIREARAREGKVTVIYGDEVRGLAGFR